MPKVTLYNQQGKQTGEFELSEAVFAVEPKEALVHQVYLTLEANAREPWADTKNKGEVRGGGKKPWKQKGTGRARHGSIRSPIWKGGGVTFGPLSVRNYKRKLTRKMSAKAVKMCLSAKVTDQKLIVLEDLSSDGKTKQMAALRKQLPGFGKTTLMLTVGKDDNLFLSTRNIPNLHLQRAVDLNVVDALHHQYIIATKKAIEVLEKRLA